MSGYCGLYGRSWIGHGSACLPSEPPIPTEHTDHADDDFWSARIRRIAREELQRAFIRELHKRKDPC